MRRINVLVSEIDAYLVQAAADAEVHDRRVTELLEANNREVERRRAVEARLSGYVALFNKVLDVKITAPNKGVCDMGER
jgi:hypothetical protein